MKKLVLIAAVIALAWFGYGKNRAAEISWSNAALVPSTATGSVAASTPSSRFSCDGRTHCSQMRSCEEATYFIQHCPNTQMDGNGDGVPCEKQWCR